MHKGGSKLLLEGQRQRRMGWCLRDSPQHTTHMLIEKKKKKKTREKIKSLTSTYGGGAARPQVEPHGPPDGGFGLVIMAHLMMDLNQ